MKKNQFAILFALCASLTSYAQNTETPIVTPDLSHLEMNYLDGKPCKMEDLKGKFILVDIWGQGCAPCVNAIPELNELQKKYKKDLVILAINDRIYLEKLPQFLKEHNVIYTVVIPKTDDEVMSIYYTLSGNKFTGFPYYVLLDRAGKILKRDTHYTKVEAYLR